MNLLITGCEINNNSNRIINIQSFSDQDLINLYKNSFSFVFPSLYESLIIDIKTNIKISEIYSWTNCDKILSKTLNKIIDDKY